MAHADFYPNVSLTGSALSLAFLTPDQDLITQQHHDLAQFGPAVSLPRPSSTAAV